MSEIWARLNKENFATLHSQTVGSYKVEIVDECLTPFVSVTHLTKKTASKFPLDKLGVYYIDGAAKFYRDEDDQEVTKGELNDMAIEAFLQSLGAYPSLFDEPAPKCANSGGALGVGYCSGKAPTETIKVVYHENPFNQSGETGDVLNLCHDCRQKVQKDAESRGYTVKEAACASNFDKIIYLG